MFILFNQNIRRQLTFKELFARNVCKPDDGVHRTAKDKFIYIRV